jgi:predicted O-methyltransferase YrrM
MAVNNKILINLPANYQPLADAVLDRGWVLDEKGERRPIDGPVSAQEAAILTQIILDHDCKRCLETGVAKGISALAITQAVARIGGHHTGVDPCQSTDHGMAAPRLLADHGLAGSFTLLEGPSHLMLPPLLARGDRFDLVFIDGMHTFQYKFLDYFYADQLLEVGGWLVFHDLVLASVKKVLRFILQEGKYEVWLTPELQPSWPRKVRFAAAATIKGRALSFFWPNGFSNLLVLRKTSAAEHRWDFFRNF